jgi:hypothetical protein
MVLGPYWLTPLLVDYKHQSSGLIPLLGRMTISGKVTNLPAVEARVGDSWWGVRRCLRRCRLLSVGDGAGVCLLLMLLGWALAPLRWLRKIMGADQLGVY